jgi:hypothetical protein
VSKKLIFSSWELHIPTDHYNYIFIGDCFFHLQEAIQTYALYSQLQARWFIYHLNMNREIILRIKGP